MTNTQKLYEIQISSNGESYLLTKETRSPFVRSDVFALPDYKRTTITLTGGDSVAMQSAVAFFDCEINSETEIFTQDGCYNFTCGKADLTPKIIKEPTFFGKLFGKFKKEIVKREFPSQSFLCIKNGETYHFIGTLNESCHAVLFDILPLEKTATCLVTSENIKTSEPTQLFDIIEIQGDLNHIISSYYELVKKLYKRAPKISKPTDVITFDITKNNTEDMLNPLHKAAGDTLCLLQNGDDLSLSAYIQGVETPIRAISNSTGDKIKCIAVLSPLLCERDSAEYEMFKTELVKNQKGGKKTAKIADKSYFILDCYSKSVQAYITRQLDLLFSIGFDGVEFQNIDVCLEASAGKCGGETCEYFNNFISQKLKGKIMASDKPYQACAVGKFDYFNITNAVFQIADHTSKNSEFVPSKWDFSAFERVISYFEVQKQFPNILPVCVPASLMSEDELTFDLCTALNMFLCKGFCVSNPTMQAVSRASEFAFLKNADVSEIIKIEDGRYAVIFTLDNFESACFFNFTSKTWEIDGVEVQPLSFNFKE